MVRAFFHHAGRRNGLREGALRAAFAGALLLVAGQAWGADSFLRPALDTRPALSPSLVPAAKAGLILKPILTAAAGGVTAVPPEPVPGAGFVRPTAKAVRIDATEAPMVDGDVSDAVWAKAQIIDKFTQKGPNPGEPATEKTVVRILYDQNNLYFSFYAYDANPSEIIARTMERDGQLYTSDSIAIYLDPGQTRRNAYNFEVGASGGRTDQLELNNTQELREWDTIWTGRARRVADGYTVEIAIPFASISYDATQTTWGFDVGRRILHKNERVYWSGYAPTLDFTDVSQSGNLTGITGVNQGLGLDVQAYGTLRSKHNWQAKNEGAGFSFTGGGNAFYKVTPALTNTLTVNPDFSDAPLDVRQVNTTRFSLFTPETRDFFLQDVSAFEFGGRSFGRSSQDRTSNNGRPFFSRNVGLAQGVPVSLTVGDKLSGQVGGFDVGVLSVLTDNTPTSSGQVLSVARVTHPILAESKVGFVLTNGDPTGRTDNTVAGFDIQYRNSNFLGGDILQADAYYMRSFSSTKGNDDSAALAINFPNEPWSGDFVFKQIGADFAPALGFVNRTDMRQYEGTVSHLTRYRGGYLNQLEFGTNYRMITDLNDRLESRENDVYVSARATRGDEASFRIIDSYENVPTLFNLPRNVPVPVGRYGWTNLSARLRTFGGRPLSLDAEVTCCRFYNGNAVHTKVRLTYRPNAYFEFIPGYDGTFIDLPTGNVDIHLLTLDSVINFLPDMQLALQTQYDNISKGFALSLRYRWEYEPGQELFASVGQTATIPNREFISQTTAAVIRLGHTFRY